MTVRIRFKAAYASAFAAGLFALASTTPATAESVADFYKGKNIDIYSGLSKGGSYSTYARLVTRHIGKHIPGNPTAVFRLKPGAVGLVLARWLNAAAPKDGLAIGTFHERIALEPLMTPKLIPFKGQDFTWIAALAINPSVCFTWAASGVKTIDDMKSREIIAGASGTSATDAVMARIMNATLGTKLKIIFGYRGADIMLALERGEVQARCGFGYPSIKAIRSQWLTGKKINILAQLSNTAHPAIPKVPLLKDLVAPEYKAAVELAGATDEIARPYAAPPGIPKDRAAALRKAFADMVKDKDFLAEAKKQRMEIQYSSGEKIAKHLAKLYKTPDKAVQQLVKFRTPGSTDIKIKRKKKKKK